MNKNAKQVYEKMVDFKNYAITLLAVGAFFYLGVIIPSGANTLMNKYIMIMASVLFLAASILCFAQSRKAKQKLMEMDDGEQYLMKK